MRKDYLLGVVLATLLASPAYAGPIIDISGYGAGGTVSFVGSGNATQTGPNAYHLLDFTGQQVWGGIPYPIPSLLNFGPTVNNVFGPGPNLSTDLAGLFWNFSSFNCNVFTDQGMVGEECRAPGVDDVVILDQLDLHLRQTQPIPEPFMFSIVGAGFVTVMAIRRRKKVA